MDKINTHGYDINREIDESDQHDDVIKWKHFSRYWPLVMGIDRSHLNCAILLVHLYPTCKISQIKGNLPAICVANDETTIDINNIIVWICRDMITLGHCLRVLVAFVVMHVCHLLCHLQPVEWYCRVRIDGTGAWGASKLRGSFWI